MFAAEPWVAAVTDQLMRTGRPRQHGFTYLAVIVMVAMIGVLLAAQGLIWSSFKRSEDIEQLDFAGNEIRRAIGSYYEQSPRGIRSYPRRVEELLRDDRFTVPKRHLRRLYRNPLTNEADWKWIPAPDGGFMGVAGSSVSEVSAPRKFIYRPALGGELAAPREGIDR